jgi:hypothetical protein
MLERHNIMELNITDRITDFIESIGIKIFHRTLEENTFLPGVLIDKGCIYIDREKLLYPGDLLHEAGHIAVVPSSDRAGLSAETIIGRKDQSAEEMMAIAWSYAACMHTGIDPYIVFHENGYKGGGHHIADGFGQGQYFGVPMLQFAGMTAEPRMAETLGMPAYPLMVKWLRD